MKNKGLVIFISVLIALACIYELSFTYFTYKFEKKAKSFATVKGQFDREKYKTYIDSNGRKPLFNFLGLKKDYYQCKDQELKLGLDLQGGMNVILEVSKGEVIRSLAGSYKEDKTLNEALRLTQIEYQKNGGDFVKTFADIYKTKSNNKPLASIFANKANQQIKSSSSDNEVISFLNSELASKSDNTRKVIETRLNQGNISQPNVQQLEGGRISVELPGADNPKKIRNLLEQSARLEFWEVYGSTEKNGYTALSKIYNPINLAYTQYLKLNKGLSIDTTKIKEINAIADSTARDSARKAYESELAKADSSKYPFAEAGLMPMIDEKGMPYPSPALGRAIKEQMGKINKMLEVDAVKNSIPSDVVFMWSAEPDTKENQVYQLFALKAGKDGEAILGSGEENIIENAIATQSSTGGDVEVVMTMTSSASKEWRQITKRASVNKDPIAIVLDKKVFSAPSVNGEIPNGVSSITGRFSVQDATDLANVLKAGKLPAPAQIVAEEQVGPTLGKESIKQGFLSLILGLIGVILLMVIYYNRGGVVATIAVLLNIFFIIGILVSFGAALTLPGIAGIVLTIGMAVDANVLIYERIREELRAGKALKSSISNGFKAAFSSIIDSNLTTLIAGLVMTFAGAGPVYGFAIILIIGIFCSLFTAILVSRLLIEYRVNKGKDFSFSNKATENFLVGANYDFIGKRKKFYIISSIVIIIGMAVLIMKGGLSTGIDFKGGYGYTIELPKGTQVESIKAALDKNLIGSSNEVKNIGSEGRYKIVTTYKMNELNMSADSIQTDLIKALSSFKATESNILSSSEVGPTIASNIRTTSMWVIIISIILIFIYIVLRFQKLSFGVGAIVALLHDVLMVFAVFALLDNIVPFALEIDQAFIAAILTVVGYSINDSVVVFDRIREFLNEFKSEKNTGKVINDAINQTLSRTLMTAGTTLIVIFILFIFGGPALKGFSLALLIGIGVGTYSSICIAAPIVLDLFKKEGNNNLKS